MTAVTIGFARLLTGRAAEKNQQKKKRIRKRSDRRESRIVAHVNTGWISFLSRSPAFAATNSAAWLVYPRPRRKSVTMRSAVG
jgi:hypothetical protein